jgi:hypothetical protein
MEVLQWVAKYHFLIGCRVMDMDLRPYVSAGANTIEYESRNVAL